jgi:tRNA-splicing ligase RtcB
MDNEKIITGKTLKQRGWPEGKIIGMAKNAAAQLSGEGLSREAILEKLDAVRSTPAEYLSDPAVSLLAQECLRRELDAAPANPDDAPFITSELRDEPLDYAVWGVQGIDAGAIEQMNNALRLPVSVAGALMPDAHVGYGLPIGGVLATKDAVIPYAVGVDIACGMRLSIY